MFHHSLFFNLIYFHFISYLHSLHDFNLSHIFIHIQCNHSVLLIFHNHTHSVSWHITNLIHMHSHSMFTLFSSLYLITPMCSHSMLHLYFQQCPHLVTIMSYHHSYAFHHVIFITSFHYPYVFTFIIQCHHTVFINSFHYS